MKPLWWYIRTRLRTSPAHTGNRSSSGECEALVKSHGTDLAEETNKQDFYMKIRSFSDLGDRILGTENVSTHLCPATGWPLRRVGLAVSPALTISSWQDLAPPEHTTSLPQRLDSCLGLLFLHRPLKALGSGESRSFFNPPGMSSARRRNASISSSCSQTNEPRHGVYFCGLF